MDILPPELKQIINEFKSDCDLKIAIVGEQNAGKKSLSFKLLFDAFPVNKTDRSQIDPTFEKTEIVVNNIQSPNQSEHLKPITVQFSIINTTMLSETGWNGKMPSKNAELCQCFSNTDKDAEMAAYLEDVMIPILKTKYDLVFITFDSNLSKLTDAMIMESKATIESVLNLENFHNVPRWLLLTKCDDSSNDGKWMQTAFECAHLVHIYDINGPIFLVSNNTNHQIDKMKTALLQYFHSAMGKSQQEDDKENRIKQCDCFPLFRSGNALSIVH